MRPALYLDRWVADPGDVLRLHGYGSGPAVGTLVRLRGLVGRGLPTGYVEEPLGAEVELRLEARSVPSGSWATVEDGPRAGTGAPWRWTLRARPTRAGHGELLAWGHDGPRLEMDGDLLRASWRGVRLQVPIDVDAWSEITLVHDGRGSLALDVAPLGGGWWRRAAGGRADAGSAAVGGPLRLGRGFDGRLESPALAVAGRPVAAWDFGVHIDRQQVPGEGPEARTLRLVNAPKRGVASADWDGSVHAWPLKPAHYRAIHFHSDDLADCGWPVDAELRVPPSAPSGVYAVRLRTPSGEARAAVFVRATRPARVAFLAPTFSYLAYGNSIWDPPSTAASRYPEDAALGRLFGRSTYCRHADGAGIGLVSQRRPLLNLVPGLLGEAIGGQVLLNDDLRILDWLHRSGEPYDVVTDHDLHERGHAAVAPYRVLVTGSHPEYHSSESLDALDAFTRRGGRLLYLGGNGFYWRVSTLPDAPHVMELRRAEGGVRKWAEPPGEYRHQSDGRLGGLWRRLGRPPNRLVGVGFSAQGYEDETRAYARTAAAADPRVAFLFDGVDAELLGRPGALGAAGGYELDRADVRLGTPPHALVVARTLPFGSRTGPVNEELLAPDLVDADDPVRGDLTFFEGPAGGAVLSAGSILFSAALDEADGMGRVVDNALRRFVDPRPFAPPAAAARAVVSFRRATLADADDLPAIARRCYGSWYEHLWEPGALERYLDATYAADVVRAELADPRVLFEVACIGGEAIAFAKTVLDAPLDGWPNAACLDRVYVERAAAGSGVGRELIERAATHAAAAGRDAIWLRVMASASRPIARYLAAGFATIGEARYEGPGMKEAERPMRIMLRPIRRES